MRPIFNEKFVKKWYLWVHEQFTDALFMVEKSSFAADSKKKKKLKRALQQRWTQQTRIQTAPKRKNEPQYKPLTSFTATPPRFFSELKGKTCRIIDSDLARSKFIPNCSTNWIQKWTSNIKLLKNNNNKKLKN